MPPSLRPHVPPESEQQRPSEEVAPIERPRITTAERGLTLGALVALAVALLPFWDAIGRFPIGLALCPLIGVVFGGAIVRAHQSASARTPFLFAIAATVAIGYAGYTANQTAIARSHAVDGFSLCEMSPYAAPLDRAASDPPRFGGPHLANGDPCVRQEDRRERHAEMHPDGDLVDGLVQIWSRFPADRNRTIFGSLIVLGALVGAGAILRRRSAVSSPRRP